MASGSERCPLARRGAGGDAGGGARRDARDRGRRREPETPSVRASGPRSLPPAAVSCARDSLLDYVINYHTHDFIYYVISAKVSQLCRAIARREILRRRRRRRRRCSGRVHLVALEEAVGRRLALGATGIDGDRHVQRGWVICVHSLAHARRALAVGGRIWMRARTRTARG